MKPISLRHYLSSLLCSFSLFISGMPALSFADTDNRNGVMTRDECPTGSDSPYQWNSARNICELKESSVAMRDEFTKCQEKETNEERNACVEAIRDAQTNYDSMEHEAKKTGWAKFSPALLWTGFQLISNSGKKNDGAKCLSRKILMGASIASFGGDLYLKISSKKQFEKLSEDYKNEQEDAYEKQIKAFDYLEEEQTTIADIAKKHKTAYTIYTAAYGAASVIALLEMSAGSSIGLTPCISVAQGEVDKAQGEVTKVEDKIGADSMQMGGGLTGLFSALFSNAEALQSANNNLSTANKASNDRSSGKKVADFLGSSPGIAIIGGLGAAISSILATHAGSQQITAEKNAKMVRDVREKFETTMAASNFCRSRDDVSQPRCYCFTSDGKRNSNRTRSETCQAYWFNQDKSLYRAASTYGGGKKEKAQGCYRIDGVWDPDCKCREVKNDQGENGCYKAPYGLNEIASLGPGIGLAQITDSLNQMYSGGLASGDIAPAQISQNAARINSARKQTLDKMKSDPQFKANGFFNDEALLEAAIRSIPKNVRQQGEQLFQEQFGQGSLNTQPPSLAGVLENTRKTAGLPTSVQLRGGFNKAKAKKKTGFSLYGEEEKAAEAGAQHMNKNYDYSVAQKDIVEREDVSIWQVISNRYTQSGLRRLFDDEAEGL